MAEGVVREGAKPYRNVTISRDCFNLIMFMRNTYLRPTMLRVAGLKGDANGRNRTLYRLRHTAIVTGIHAGISIETLAMNARTSSDMIDRFYGAHITSARDKGTEIVDSGHAKRERYAEIAEERVRVAKRDS